VDASSPAAPPVEKQGAFLQRAAARHAHGTEFSTLSRVEILRAGIILVVLSQPWECGDATTRPDAGISDFSGLVRRLQRRPA